MNKVKKATLEILKRREANKKLEPPLKTVA
jgi:hypothetical protein